MLKNINKILLIKIFKILSFINLDKKDIQAINNTNLDVTKDLRLANIKKY